MAELEIWDRRFGFHLGHGYTVRPSLFFFLPCFGGGVSNG
jgi:hypothetical protein